MVRFATPLDPNVEVKLIVSAFEYAVPVLELNVTALILEFTSYTINVSPAENEVVSVPEVLPVLT